MSFDYDKLKEKHSDQSYWATSSDLFMVMSLVFLLLYVVAGLRTSTYSIKKQMEYRRVSELNEDLKQQLKVYNTLKENYLETKASDSEMEVYNQLMGKLDLLQEEANDEKQKLRQQALQNEQKEQALNQYQQMIRNIINSNLMAKATIQRRSKQLSKARQEKEELSTKFKDIEKNLKSAKSELSTTQQKLATQNREREKLAAELSEAQSQFKDKVAAMQKEFKQKQLAERKEFESKLKKQKLSSKQRRQALQKFIAQQKKQLSSKIDEQKEQFNAQIQDLSSGLKASKKELSKAKARLNARKELAQRIKNNFKKAGVDATVDPKTGDVILNFGDEYFDTGKHNLKDGMKNVLQKSIPVYARSLFADNKIASKLTFVEIVGFASPTYQGKYIDPQSMTENDRKAINYNLDLSYYRARSIFEHIFNTKKMSYDNQSKLRSLVKVTGRSFLAEKIKNDERSIASGMSQKEFCKLYDCLKAQRVIIKFDLED